VRLQQTCIWLSGGHAHTRFKHVWKYVLLNCVFLNSAKNNTRLWNTSIRLSGVISTRLFKVFQHALNLLRCSWDVLNWIWILWDFNNIYLREFGLWPGCGQKEDQILPTDVYGCVGTLCVYSEWFQLITHQVHAVRVAIWTCFKIVRSCIKVEGHALQQLIVEEWTCSAHLHVVGGLGLQSWHVSKLYWITTQCMFLHAILIGW